MFFVEEAKLVPHNWWWKDST